MPDRKHCNNCGTNVDKSQFKRHLQRCTSGSGSIKCPDCRYYTNSNNDLTYHRLRKHSNNLPSVNECAICKETFPGFYQLQIHKRQVHGTFRKVHENIGNNLE